MHEWYDIKGGETSPFKIKLEKSKVGKSGIADHI